MAIDYDSADSGLFTHLGKIVKHYNLQAADAASLDADSQEIIEAIETLAVGDPDIITSPIRPAVLAWKDHHVSRRNDLVSWATARLQDRASVVDELGLPADDVQQVIAALISRMEHVDSESVQESTASYSGLTVTPQVTGATNKGTALVSLTLDGVTPPSGRANPHLDYKDKSTTLCLDELHTLTCDSDSFSGGLPEGSEGFSWHGQFADADNGVESPGSGEIGSVQCLHGRTEAFLENADFESFTVANTPDSWTISAGTAGVHIFSDATSGNFYHGETALKLTGDGALAAITLKQAPISSLLANRQYAVAVRIKASASVSAGDLTIKMVGTGYTEGSAEKISVAAASLPTSWTLKSFFFNAPNNIPSDFALQISWSNTPTNAKNLWIDDIAFGEVTFGGGVGVAVVRGSNPWVVGDRITFTTAISGGVFQQFFASAFAARLPQSSSPTIDDALAS